VTRVLKATPGVSDAVVELAAKRATVTFDPAKTSVPALKSAVDDAGYAAS
jgi:copper chaperone